MNKNLKTVLHISKTPVAGSMGNLNTCLNKYSYYNSLVYCQKPSINISNFICDYQNNLGQLELSDAFLKADILHFHNCTYENFSKYETYFLNKPMIFQLHSEPSIKRDVLKKFRKHCITIAQKHATLYENPIYVVPNIFDIYEERYLPDYKDPNVVNIFYSATSVVKHSDYTKTCGGKGYTETIEILDKIKKRYGSKVNIIKFIKEDKVIVLKEKRKADIVIDECVTGGYHITSLEGLSMGCIVINGLNNKVEKVFRDISGLEKEKGLPFRISNLNNLYKNLEFLIELKFDQYDEFLELQKWSRNFMERFWHPSKMVNYFEKLYDKYLGVNSNPYSHLKYSNNLDRVREDRNKSKEKYNNHLFQKLKKIDNIYETFENKGYGKEALVLGLGPSVNKIDINKYIKNCDVFSCNFYYNKFNKEIIDYWCCIDAGAFKEAVNNIYYKATVVANYPVNNCIEFYNRRVWITDHINKLNYYFKSGIEFERPFTVATIMLAIAIYMRYDVIYLVGIDLSLKKIDNNYCYNDLKLNLKFRDFSNNYKWIIKEFKKLKNEANIRGIKIINLDPEPKNLDIFDRIK